MPIICAGKRESGTYEQRLPQYCCEDIGLFFLLCNLTIKTIPGRCGPSPHASAEGFEVDLGVPSRFLIDRIAGCRLTRAAPPRLNEGAIDA
jgi:hypothetical protein